MNGVRVLRVESPVSGDIVQGSFLSNRSLSKHPPHIQVKGSNITLLYIWRGQCNWRSVSLIFWRLGKRL